MNASAQPGPAWTIRAAEGDTERKTLVGLFQRHIPGVANDAVPSERNDHLWNPIVLVTVADGQIVGGLLSCRSPISADLLIAFGSAGQDNPYVRNADRVSMLDLLAVDEAYRGDGIAAALVDHARATLSQAGVRFWFGNSVAGLNNRRLAEFYEARGFAIVPRNVRLPPFLGLDWDPTALEVEMWFWQRLQPPVSDRRGS